MNENNKTKLTVDEIKNKLDPISFEVTQNEATEQAFSNAYWNHKDQGIYVDVVSGEALFCSIDKYDSGSGWPSFSQPIEQSAIVEKVDTRLMAQRVEVRSQNADSHLGHVFEDGPQPTGLRYCINSAALRFVALENLEKEGYSMYLELFK